VRVVRSLTRLTSVRLASERTSRFLSRGSFRVLFSGHHDGERQRIQIQRPRECSGQSPRPAALHLDLLLESTHSPILCSLIHRFSRTQTRLESWQVLDVRSLTVLGLISLTQPCLFARSASTTRSRSTSTRRLRSAVSPVTEQRGSAARRH
jgi:hypothetical protein